MATGVVDVREVWEELKRIPDHPSLERLTDGTYSKINKKQHDVSCSFYDEKPFALINISHHQVIQKISRAHIDSFDFMLEEGLPKGVKNIKPLEMMLPNGDKLKISIMDVVVGNPRVSKDAIAKTSIVFPSEVY